MTVAGVLLSAFARDGDTPSTTVFAAAIVGGYSIVP